MPHRPFSLPAILLRAATRPRGTWRTLKLQRSTTDVGPYRIHSVEMGVGTEPIVLLHGLSGSSRWWHRNIIPFARRYRVVIPDMVGFGRSRIRGPLPDIPGIAALLGEWMERAAPGAAHLVGHSMGGQLALHLAARRPELLGRLVLVGAAGIPRPLTPAYALRFARELAPPTRWGDPAFLPVIAGDAFSAGPLTLMRAATCLLRDDVRPLLGKIAVPTLIIWGARDAWVPLAHGRELRQQIPGSRLLVLRGAAHNAMVDRPGAFNTAVLRFLRGVEVGE